MGIFPRRAGEQWHHELLNSGADQCLFGPRPFYSFPFGTLSSATDVYIKKKRLIPESQACDAALVGMVLEHAQREGGVKDVAVLACLHALSHMTGSTLLVSLREECSDQRFLRCLILSHYANGSIVRANECQAAKALVQLLAGQDFLETVRQLFRELTEDGGNPNIMTASYINSILRSTKFDTNFDAHLKSLRQQRRYMSLYNAVSWLGAIANTPDNSTARSVITTILPDWMSWISWRPNFFRLMQWEGGNFTESQRQRLSPVFDLEGPDPTGHGFPSLKESTACFQSIRILDRDRSLLEGLLSLLDAVQLVPGRHAVDLFIFLCVENRNPIDRNLLSLVRAILDTRNDDCIDAMHLWLSNLRGFNNRMVALTKMLPVLGSHPSLQEVVGHDIGSDVVEVMAAARGEFNNMLSTGIPDNLAMKIHAFGSAIKDSTWLHPALDPDFLQGLQVLPPQETIIEILDSSQGPHAPVDLVKQYLSAVIGGRRGDATGLLSSIQGSISFYGRGIHPDRASLATAIGNLGFINVEVHQACRERILDEDIYMVRDLLAVTRSDSNNSCVAFARLLCRRMTMQPTVHDCWLSLLLCILLERRDDILVWSAEELPVDQWFQWVGDLRTLFPHSDGHISVTDLNFTPRKYEWWDLLRRYGRAIAKLESLYKRRANLRWLWFQEFSDIPVLLDLLERPSGRLSAGERFILSYLSPTIYVIRLVCESLGALARASDTGRIAFESVFTRYQQINQEGWSEAATQALMVSWRQSISLNSSDREGLLTLSELLGLGPSVDGDGISVARQSLISDHARVIAMARELEDMRLRLRNDDSSTLPRTLGVEDGRPDADPEIPDRLSSVVERLGPKQWEMCFPLTHLDHPSRQGLGLDDASRLLLVRISFLRQQQPAFCIHFHPNDEEMDNHGPWYVDAEMPDGRVCWTRPSPLLYVLSRALHGFLANGNRDLLSVYDMISARLATPSDHCMVCSTSMGSRLWRPTVCSSACSEVLQRAPMEVRVAGLISDPPVLDLLLTSIYSASFDNNMTLDLLPGCPFPREKIREVIDSFPALPAHARPSEILSHIRTSVTAAEGDGVMSDAEKLLTWMSIQFRGCLVSSPQNCRIPGMPGVIQFMMLNGDPSREQQFSALLASQNGETGRSAVGGVTFHGAAVERLWRGLTEGLRASLHGRPGLQVQGVALADEADLMMGYAGDTTSGGWARSELQKYNVMLVCELAGHTWQTYHTISEEARIAVRYVLLCPRGFTPPRTTQIGGHLRAVFQGLGEGKLVDRA
ncbi:hypothetical protein QBC47DRAFT_302159 [Echria macrotheca]|uniref:Uncharacterized protein n=1 Tax=Echria macrotheca TaxID=438768 RepID=A0AAJ0B9Y2_9PEZI|nr:hypothetical protein QBC47DRAFT_302159 [Echria macrotheca]